MDISTSGIQQRQLAINDKPQKKALKMAKEKRAKQKLPSMPKSDLASGEAIAVRAFGKSEFPTSITGFPGQNIRDEGFGVGWV